MTINPDGQSVSYKLDPSVNERELHTQTFVYRVALVPAPDGKPLTSNATSFIAFVFNATDKPSEGECAEGRRVGPTPTPTDER